MSALRAPRTAKTPVVGTVTRERTLRVVLLPAPFEPMRPTVLAAVHLEADVPQRPEIVRVRGAGPKDSPSEAGDLVTQRE
jgi:hypothetical protein